MRIYMNDMEHVCVQLSVVCMTGGKNVYKCVQMCMTTDTSYLFMYDCVCNDLAFVYECFHFLYGSFEIHCACVRKFV